MTSFTYLDVWEDAISHLSPEQQAEARLAIITYGIKGEVLDNISPTSKAIVMLVAPVIDAEKESNKTSKRGNPNFKKGQKNPYQQNTEKDNSEIIQDNSKDNSEIINDNSETIIPNYPHNYPDNYLSGIPPYNPPYKEILSSDDDNTKKEPSSASSGYVARLEDVDEFFATKTITIDNLCRELKVDKDSLHTTSVAIYHEWDATDGLTHRDKQDFTKHLISHLRVKHRNNGNNKNDKRRRVEVPTDTEGYYSNF